MSLCHSAEVVSTSRRRAVMLTPAQLTSTSRRPNRSTVSRTAAVTSASLLTSAAMPTTRCRDGPGRATAMAASRRPRLSRPRRRRSCRGPRAPRPSPGRCPGCRRSRWRPRSDVIPSPLPRSSPRTSSRCANEKTRMAGMLITIEAAMSSPQRMPFSSMKKASATESGRRSSPLVKTSANRNSFQARMKEYMATATRAGRDIGMHDLPEQPRQRAAVDDRRLLDLHRDLVEEALEQPDGHREGHHQVDQDQALVGVHDLQVAQRHEERDDDDDAREELREQHRPQQRVAAGDPVAREAVAAEHADDQGDGRRRAGDEERVEEGCGSASGCGRPR